jgi:hypothetical protein
MVLSRPEMASLYAPNHRRYLVVEVGRSGDCGAPDTIPCRVAHTKVRTNRGSGEQIFGGAKGVPLRRR